MPVELPTSSDGLTQPPSPLQRRLRAIQGNRRLAQLTQDVKSLVQSTFLKTWEYYYAQRPLKRVLLLLAVTCATAAGVLFLIFHNKVLELLLRFATSWRELRAGPVIMFALVCVISFPPLIGYSALASLCGMMYGVGRGWLLLTLATVCGSLVSFGACRVWFQGYAARLARRNAKFAALARTMEADGFRLLWMIRLCPLPYSLSNGALASIPTVTAARFALATLVTSPKLAMHTFIGDRIARLGTETDSASRAMNVLSVVVAGTVGTVTAYTIYVRTIERAEGMDGVVYGDLELGPDSDDGSYQDDFDVNDDADLDLEDASDVETVLEVDEGEQHK